MTLSASLIPPLVQSGQYCKIPPGVYEVDAFYPTEWPLALGMTGLRVDDKSDFVIDARGVTITGKDGFNGCNYLLFHNCARFRVIGLTFVANNSNITHPINAACLTLLGVDDFVVEDLAVSGVAGRVGINGNWMRGGLFSRVRMDAIYEGWDVAFLRHTTFRDCRAYGIAGVGLEASPSPFGMINVGDDHAFSDQYPAARPSWWNGGNTSARVTIENCTASHFQAGVAIRAGAAYMIRGNSFTGNGPGTTYLGPTGERGGAGIIVWSDSRAPVQSDPDPIRQVMIAGNLFAANSSGADVVIDATDPAAPMIDNVLIAGNMYETGTAASRVLIAGSVQRVVNSG